ncbi:unnamed protein product [Schistosoma curassoni]|uniref:Uncharacterized protein n=1 Tax=Schistosoma curassoni TaxID=6186 RepID=A0A183JDT1_9TREM|nr:unnamed protein product [Schistosoma curassoni]
MPDFECQTQYIRLHSSNTSWLNCVISGIPSSYNNSNTPNYHIGIAMERFDIHSDFDAFEDYMELFEIWAMTKDDVEDVTIVAHSVTLIG